ncbi:hypothetical protein FRC02_011258 [Tulasnella sp. 418]|nr:hypothetical protein FRC02_011258 [Tulasnella sp. 418]
MPPKSKHPVQSKLSFPAINSVGPSKDKKSKVEKEASRVTTEAQAALVTKKPSTVAEASRQLRQERIRQTKDEESDGPSAWEGWEEDTKDFEDDLVESSDDSSTKVPGRDRKPRSESSASSAATEQEEKPRPIKAVAKPTVIKTNRRTSTGNTKKRATNKSPPPSKRYPPLPAPNKFKNIVKTKAYKDYYAYVVEQMDGDDLGHEHQDTVIDVVLRVFDLTYEYGPCVGFSRMERWKRAKELGLDPPEVVRDILEVEEEGIDNCVFHGQV